MKRLFLDTNILIDFLAKREPHAKFARFIFINSTKGEYELFTSHNSITTCYYILEKEIGIELAKKVIITLLGYLEIVNVSKSVLIQAVKSDFRDFEDAVQYYSAFKIENLSAIVTRNKRDFKSSRIPVVSGEEL
jgi:predicted nucleic acid-binding protein